MVFWGFWASIGLFLVPNTAEGISEFCEDINELLFFRNVSWVFWLFSNIELVLLLFGNKLIEFSSLLFLFLFESSILNNFCWKIDDWPWLLLLILLSNNDLLNMGSFLSSSCSFFIFISYLISPGSNSFSFSFSSFFSSFFSVSFFFSGTTPNLIFLSSNLISLLSEGASPLNPKLTLILGSILLSLIFSFSFSFFTSIMILLLCSLDLSFESLIFELWLWISFLFKLLLLIFELLTPKVTLDEFNIEL